MVTLEFAPFLQNVAFNVRPFHYFAIFATIYIAFADNNQTSLKNNYICLLKQNENYV